MIFEIFRAKFFAFSKSSLFGLPLLIPPICFSGPAVSNPLHENSPIISIPLFIQTVLIFGITYFLAKKLHFTYQDAAPSAMIGASNHFEVAIATSATLFGLSSGASLATVVGVLIEVPLMLGLVAFCKKTKNWF